MLIVFGGLPGVGKTTVAKQVALELGATYLRIDSIEQAIKYAKVLTNQVGIAGYSVAHALAAENLRLGNGVVVDCVNPLEVTREGWRSTAARVSTPILEIEVICSDTLEHQRRVEQRQADIPGHLMPTWESVVSHDYEPWVGPRLVIDTARSSVSEAVTTIITTLKLQMGSP
jgi:predicted kinase